MLIKNMNCLNALKNFKELFCAHNGIVVIVIRRHLQHRSRSSASSAGRHSGRSSRGASRDRARSQSSERGHKQPGPDSAQAGARSKTREPSHIQGPDSVPADAPTAAVAPTELDDELLQILGDDPSKTKNTGKDIQTDLAVRLQHIATSGLTKEVRKELLEKYLPPGNCTLIDAPELNPEVKAAISESTYKRDKAIKIKQKQLASATSCVAEALTILLSSESRNMTLIKLLMDATKLLCDGQNQDSVTRRNFVLYNLKKELKDQLQATKIDKFLFSQDLADTLKTAKAISKSGADMKVTPVQQNTKKVSKPATKTLNWRAPQQNHKPRGPPRSKEAARKPQPDNSSKQSSRRPPTSSRTRQ
ncbi:hypothetical protein NE865_01587 [Phthorimaea operculella]|nr:hypothetical protein NE865_01587 [Phthorimaea operculella]